MACTRLQRDPTNRWPASEWHAPQCSASTRPSRPAFRPTDSRPLGRRLAHCPPARACVAGPSALPRRKLQPPGRSERARLHGRLSHQLGDVLARSRCPVPLGGLSPSQMPTRWRPCPRGLARTLSRRELQPQGRTTTARLRDVLSHPQSGACPTAPDVFSSHWAAGAQLPRCTRADTSAHAQLRPWSRD